jgi:hypothetical protein
LGLKRKSIYITIKADATKCIKRKDFNTLNQRAQKGMGAKQLTTLNWTIVDSDGSLFSRGKRGYYAILVRGIPEEHPKDCVIELYVTDKEMTIFEIKVNADNEQLELLSRSIVLGNLGPETNVIQAVEEMKDAAESRENENPYSSISIDYTVR